MTARIIPLFGAAEPTKDHTVNEQMIAGLEYLLAAAKEGKIIGAVIGMVAPDGHSMTTVIKGEADLSQLAAAGAVIFFRVGRLLEQNVIETDDLSEGA